MIDHARLETPHYETRLMLILFCTEGYALGLLKNPEFPFRNLKLRLVNRYTGIQTLG